METTAQDLDYLGRKRAAAPTIIGHMPYPETYVEGFLGTGAVMNAMPRVPRMIGCEIDPSTVATFDYPAAAEIYCEDVMESAAVGIACASSRTVLYLDPPYHPDTRTSHHRYRHELDDAGHRRLLTWCRALDCRVMISGYRCGLYDRELRDWRRVDYPVMTRGGARIESLWMNFAPALPWHHTQAGRNKCERQQIKRKAESAGRKYAAMSMGERLAVRAAMAAVDAAGAVETDYIGRRSRK